MSRLSALARSLLRDCRGASATEFVLILPVLALLIFATIDAGWFAWQINLAEKATQAGARMAVVTDPVASGLTTEDYTAAKYGLTQGDVIPATALATVTCTGTASSSSCSGCGSGATQLSSCTASAAAFKAIADRMRYYDSAIQYANVVVEYRGSGLGYAGDPAGMQIAPTVTVRLQNMRMNALTSYVWKTAINLPDFAYSLTMEDGSGSKSN